MSHSTQYDSDGNMVGQTLGTNTITVFCGRKVGDNNYGNREASIHMQIDVTEDDTLEVIEKKIRETFVFAQTLVDRQLGMDAEMNARANHPTARTARVEEAAVRRLGPKAVPSARKAAPKKSAASSDKDALWQDWLENPDGWWDNRPEITGKPKPNPRGPDLKHKKNGDALWLDNAPEFVKLTLNGDAEVF